MLVRLTPMRIATSTLRALRVGQKALSRQENPVPDIRPPTPVPLAKDNRHVFPTKRTMYIMMNGTGVPCTQADTAGVAGRSPDGIAGKREIKVGVIGYYSWLDHLKRPVPEPASTTHVVSAAEAADFGILMCRATDSRGYGSAPRVQIVGDGADWIANIAQQAFPDASHLHRRLLPRHEHLHAFCLELHLPDVATRQEYRRLKGLLFRHGAFALIRRLKTHTASRLTTLPLPTKNSPTSKSGPRPCATPLPEKRPLHRLRTC